MIQYSGGSIIHRTYTPASRLDQVTNITWALNDAGWTTISGTPGTVSTPASSDVIQESAPNNSGAKIRLRTRDPATGSSALCSLKHPTGGSADTADCCVGFTNIWRIIATPHNVGAFMTTAANRQAQRGSMFAGTLYTPAFLGITSADAVGYMTGSQNSDGDANSRIGWRVTLRNQTGFVWVGGGTIYKTTTVSGAGYGNPPNVLAWQGGQATGVWGDNLWRWDDGSQPVFEPLVSFATPTAAVESMIHGQLYDAIMYNVAAQTVAGESTFTLDGHTWMNICDQGQIQQGYDTQLAFLIA